jgi:hypothetical protein
MGKESRAQGRRGKESRVQENGKETAALLCVVAERWGSGERVKKWRERVAFNGLGLD